MKKKKTQDLSKYGHFAAVWSCVDYMPKLYVLWQQYRCNLHL